MTGPAYEFTFAKQELIRPSEWERINAAVADGRLRTSSYQDADGTWFHPDGKIYLDQEKAQISPRFRSYTERLGLAEYLDDDDDDVIDITPEPGVTSIFFLHNYRPKPR